MTNEKKVPATENTPATENMPAADTETTTADLETTTAPAGDEAGRRLWAELQVTRLFSSLPISWDEVEELVPFLTRGVARRFLAGEEVDFTCRTLFVELFRWHPGLAQKVLANTAADLDAISLERLAHAFGKKDLDAVSAAWNQVYTQTSALECNVFWEVIIDKRSAGDVAKGQDCSFVRIQQFAHSIWTRLFGELESVQ